jgi:branched-chain amino acid transport system substrate-binding protein
MTRASAFSLIALTIAVLAAAAVAKPATATRTAGAAPIDCTGATLGFAGPLTGPAAFLGQEQISWSRFAAAQYNRRFKTSFKVVQGDTQLSASLAREVGREFVSNPNILGVIGPSTSQAVISSARLFGAAELAAVSGLATRTDLTTGGNFTTFFRVVPNDFVEAPSIVNFAIETLDARRVVVIDSQDDYSIALATSVTYRFRLKGVRVDRESVAAANADLRSLAMNVASDAQVAVFVTRSPAAAQALSSQLRVQGKRAVVFGTDGAYSRTQFRPRIGYVSSFAPDIRLVPGGEAVVRAYEAFSNNRSFGRFGPPSYVAAWVLMRAISRSCRDSTATRAEVTASVRRTNIPSILGGSIRFTTKGDVVGAKFYVFKIANGEYTLAG